MTTTTTGTENPVRTYGNWAVPVSPGLFGLGTLGTVLIFVGLAATVLVQLGRGWVWAGVVLVLFLLVIGGIAKKNRAGRNVWQTSTTRVAWWRGKRKRQHLYLAGTVAPVAFGAARLPGLLARSELFLAQSSTGEHFALLSMPSARHYAVVLRCEPEGSQLVDQDTVDTWVALFGRFLADLAHEPGLEACSVTVETAPDPGTRLAAEIHRQIDPSSPALAQAMLREAAATFPSGSASVRAWVTLTFTARRSATVEDETPLRKGRRAKVSKDAQAVLDLTALERGHDPAAGTDDEDLPSMLPAPAAKPKGVRTAREMAEQIGQRLPGLVAQLRGTGAGAVRAMTPTELAETVRVAYDPAAALALEQAHAAGEDSGVTWETAGPMAQVESWGALRHESAASITWAAISPPAGAVQSSVLGRLLAPHPGLSRKRVTFVYRPFDPATAARIADEAVKTANTVATARRGQPGAADTLALSAARQTAAEQAAGAGLVRQAVLVTATVDDPAQLPAAAEAVDQLGGASRLRLRRCYGSQAASFAAALGVGVVLPKHVVMPDVFRNAL
ncbi:hypothetical protein CLV35_0222 [Motilibacter peucedani]|uniref:Integral membrane protein n=1 Tax=Motilibacter peucedani TaxID=598650 RepID=A0A420XUV4_9ACTN|nr:SCO6880 family protein [Motilibacter peucedani]RKS80633.1 hypothetical protein CLV35_0222 [Motilibacter peucedani]